MKLLRNLGIGTILLIVLAVAALFVGLPHLVKAGAETVSTDVMGTKTTVDSADVDLGRGAVALHQYQVKNPEGFAQPRFLNVGRIRVGAGVTDLRKDPVEVSEILIERPEVTVEQALSGTNLQQIMDSITRRPGSRWKIQSLKIQGGSVRFVLPILGRDTKVDVPDIELKEITNRDGSPAMLGDVIRQVLQQMVVRAADSAALPTDFRVQLDDVLNLDAVRKQIEERMDDAQKQIDDVKGRFEGILNPKKK